MVQVGRPGLSNTQKMSCGVDGKRVDWTPVNGPIVVESPYRPELGGRTYERLKLYA